MAVRTALLNGNNIARDTDFSKYIETVSEPGVIEGLTVTSTKVAIGKARVPCLRTNGETIFALVSVTSEVTISGNGDVYIEVSQTYIDNGELANEDGTGIATIKVGTMPSKNALKLATISNGVVTDARNMIAKVGELKTYIQSLNSRMNTAEQKIDQIIEDKAVDHLEETGLVGEKYTLANTLFKQLTPTFANSTVDSNVGDTDANKQIHIQRLATGTASNKLKLKAKKIGAPTTGLVIEVRRGVQVDVSDTEAYWYGNELVCSGSIPYSSISTDYQEFEVTMNGQFGGTKGEKLDIVVYQTGNIVNSTNYYAIACDSTQYSEGFSFVAVNGTTRTRSKLMPYCIADGFAQSMLCKVGTGNVVCNTETFTLSEDKYSTNSSYTTLWSCSFYGSGQLTINAESYMRSNSNEHSGHEGARILVDGVVVSEKTGYNTVAGTHSVSQTLGGGSHTVTFQCKGYPASWTSSGGWRSGSSVSFQHILYPRNDNYGHPTSRDGIGEVGKYTIFGMYNGSFFKNDKFEDYLTISGTSQSATTGSISPGNFVGYLQIGSYKIPYYL